MGAICASAPGAVLKSEDAREELRALELPEAESRRGYGPEGRHLSAADTLTFASMDLLRRDDDIGTEVDRLARERPSCDLLDPMVPTRLVVEHGISAGEFRREIDPSAVAEIIWLIHDGLVRQLTSTQRARTRAEIDHLVETAIGIFTKGLLACRAEA